MFSFLFIFVLLRCVSCYWPDILQHPLRTTQATDPPSLAPTPMIVGIRGSPSTIEIRGASTHDWRCKHGYLDMIYPTIPLSLYSCICDGQSVTEVKLASRGTKVVAIRNNAAVVITHAPDDPLRDKRLEFAVCVRESHTLELLPNNLLAVATSGRSESDGIDIYNISDFKYGLLESEPRPVQRISGFPAIHGLLWDDKKQRLWAVGNDKSPADEEAESRGILRGYALHNGLYHAVEAYVISEPAQLVGEWKGSAYPSFAKWWNGPHDLTGIPGTQFMLITSDLDVHAFDTTTREFLDTSKVIEMYLGGFQPVGERIGFDNEELPHSDIKGISINTAGDVLYVQAQWQYWFGKSVRIIGNGTFKEEIPFEKGLYKARWFEQTEG